MLVSNFWWEASERSAKSPQVVCGLRCDSDDDSSKRMADIPQGSPLIGHFAIHESAVLGAPFQARTVKKNHVLVSKLQCSTKNYIINSNKAPNLHT